MSAVAVRAPEPDWLASARTRQALTGLDRRIRESVGAADPGLWAVTRTLQRRGGKRIRPAVLLVAAEFGTFRPDRLMDAAAALELLHLGAVCHDDAVSRRRGAGVNARWGERVAVLTGTFLAARAVALLAGYDDSCGRDAASVIARACTGRLRAAENVFAGDRGEAEYLRVLTRLTATRFELPCRLGALLAKAPADVVETLSGYGRELGVAAQLADDALDHPGVPCAHPPGFRPADAARTLVDRAKDRLRALPDNPARESLWRLADHVVSRGS